MRRGGSNAGALGRQMADLAKDAVRRRRDLMDGEQRRQWRAAAHGRWAQHRSWRSLLREALAAHGLIGDGGGQEDSDSGDDGQSGGGDFRVFYGDKKWFAGREEEESKWVVKTI
ncbi:hypothetical protein Scep_023419 [Stephania cephalantha]|uniref:Uncharacterized protein n=1 Tax=Stephania cephalantha TaxID=152367 RepID=A0AAP0HXC3_9MAGN